MNFYQEKVDLSKKINGITQTNLKKLQKLEKEVEGEENKEID